MGYSLFHFLTFLTSASCFSTEVHSWNSNQQYNQGNNYEGSSDLVKLEYHMGPVLSSTTINLYTIWYGHWNPTQQATIRDFLSSFNSSSQYPSVADWWHTVRLYTDQTGSNITGNIVHAGEYHDSTLSHGTSPTRLAIQSIIKTAVTTYPAALPLNPRNGLYLVLTSYNVQVEDFCREVCGFHSFTFPDIVGATVPYAWVGYSGTQCPETCALPFVWPKYNNGWKSKIGAPNGDVGTDGMISIIAHELAEVSSNPLLNAWYAGDDPTALTEIADLCMGVYGSGGGGGYIGQVYKDAWGNAFNLNGVNGRRFLVQWIWNPLRKRCFGPNAKD